MCGYVYEGMGEGEEEGRDIGQVCNKGPAALIAGARN